MFHRHYSRRAYRDGRNPKKIIGPGEYLALKTPDSRALCIWRNFISMDDQTGVNCSIFRNEGSRFGRSSALLDEAQSLAWARWPGARLYTYVNPKKVQSPNPGYCFKVLGWKHVGETKSGLHILALEGSG